MSFIILLLLVFAVALAVAFFLGVHLGASEAVNVQSAEQELKADVQADKDVVKKL